LFLASIHCRPFSTVGTTTLVGLLTSSRMTTPDALADSRVNTAGAVSGWLSSRVRSTVGIFLLGLGSLNAANNLPDLLIGLATTDLACATHFY
jgi:hypothetical protein